MKKDECSPIVITDYPDDIANFPVDTPMEKLATGEKTKNARELQAKEKSAKHPNKKGT